MEREFPSLPELPAVPPLPSEELPEPPRINSKFPPLEEPYSGELAEPEPLEMPFPKARERAEISGGAIYMEVDKYRDVLDGINSIKESIKAADDALQRLNELKNSREKELGRWHAKIEDIQRKLYFIDKSLFEGK